MWVERLAVVDVMEVREGASRLLGGGEDSRDLESLTFCAPTVATQIQTTLLVEFPKSR